MRLSIVLTLALTLASTAFADPPAAAPGPWMQRAEKHQPIYATLHTDKGDIVLQLDTKHAPKTVENWVGLASGEKPWLDADSGQWVKRPMYDGTVFHRVIKGFMIQGGDPTGTGRGDPGFTVDNEHTVAFTRPGLLAMANRGPNTNGCQFFITVSKPVWLNGQYSIFGKVARGYKVVLAISTQPTRGQRPVDPVKIDQVTLSEKLPKPAHHRRAKGGKKG